MRAGVRNRVGDKVVGKIFTQRHHIRRDYPQILGDERQAQNSS
jgi:hypothetical protein